MFVLSLSPGQVVAVGDITVTIGALEEDRVRVTVNAPAGSRVKLMPEDVAVPAKITASRTLMEQIHVGDDVRIWVVKLRQQSARLGFEAPRDCHIQKTWLTPEEDPWMLPADGD